MNRLNFSVIFLTSLLNLVCRGDLLFDPEDFSTESKARESIVKKFAKHVNCDDPEFYGFDGKNIFTIFHDVANAKYLIVVFPGINDGFELFIDGDSVDLENADWFDVLMVPVAHNFKWSEAERRELALTTKVLKSGEFWNSGFVGMMPEAGLELGEF